MWNVQGTMQHLFQGYSARKGVGADSKKSNMGIGLSVCAAIVKAHGGTISGENRQNGGTVFRFVLDTEEKEQNE